ncbi:hypothetical protein [Tunturiibacter gelidiferens]|uniref:hypothetical protein n=1 Tax=Tunturiibacter gelidiferens TaxID=3069689 RepID=UPI003D9AB986
MVARGEGHRSKALRSGARSGAGIDRTGNQKARQPAFKIRPASGSWNGYLTQRRPEIDRKFDCRCSVLPLVLSNLVTGARLNEDELQGLGEDKLGSIHRAALKPRRRGGS